MESEPSKSTAPIHTRWVPKGMECKSPALRSFVSIRKYLDKISHISRIKHSQHLLPLFPMPVNVCPCCATLCHIVLHHTIYFLIYSPVCSRRRYLKLVKTSVILMLPGVKRRRHFGGGKKSRLRPVLFVCLLLCSCLPAPQIFSLFLGERIDSDPHGG